MVLVVEVVEAVDVSLGVVVVDCVCALVTSATSYEDQDFVRNCPMTSQS